MICNKEKCTGCSACYNICPKKCISMEYDDEGFIYPLIDKNKCVNCGMCRKVCPIINDIKNDNRIEPKTICAYHIDDKILEDSSSGGVFTALADYVIRQKGIVIGAMMNENLELFHTKAEKREEYEKMRGSKYLQSEIRDNYIEAKKYLEQNKLVLFIGCPCQIAGLYGFLENKYYENLITVDLICHGAASKRFFDKYIEEKEKKYKNKIKSISFRDKKRGYSKYITKITFENGKEIYINAIKDSYMTSYMKYSIYRESCYQCKFAKLPRIADFTIGDFREIKDKSIIDRYEKGISVILLNNKKSDIIFNCIKKDLACIERPLEEATSTNRNITKPSIRPDGRSYILKEEGTTKELQRKYCKRLFKEYIANMLGYKIMLKLRKKD